jgi:hypothetical protein
MPTSSDSNSNNNNIFLTTENLAFSLPLIFVVSTYVSTTTAQCSRQQLHIHRATTAGADGRVGFARSSTSS